jgi:hypothetical protein
MSALTFPHHGRDKLEAMDAWHFIAERKIREAMDEGAFDRLEGQGKPLDLSENPFEDPSERMANRLLKNNGLVPGWIEEAKEIAAESRRLRAQGELTTDDLRSRASTLNRRILAFNLKAPALSLHKQSLKIDS